MTGERLELSWASRKWRRDELASSGGRRDGMTEMDLHVRSSRTSVQSSFGGWQLQQRQPGEAWRVQKRAPLQHEHQPPRSGVSHGRDHGRGSRAGAAGAEAASFATTALRTSVSRCRSKARMASRCAWASASNAEGGASRASMLTLPSGQSPSRTPAASSRAMIAAAVIRCLPMQMANQRHQRHSAPFRRFQRQLQCHGQRHGRVPDACLGGLPVTHVTVVALRRFLFPS